MLLRTLTLSTLLAAPALAQTAEYIPLPPSIGALGLSGDGLVVVGSGRNPTIGLKWTEAGGMVQLLGPAGESVPARAWSANQDGSVIVGAMNLDGAQRPCRWAGSNLGVPLNDAPLSGGGVAYGVSADGLAVAGDGEVSADALGFFWSPEGFHDLGAPDLGGFGFVTCLSHDGRFAVGFTGGADGGYFLRWDCRTLAVEVLRLADGHSPLLGTPNAVNQDGSVVVGSASPNAPGQGIRPVMWTSQGLQNFDAGAGSAKCVSADGRVVLGQGRYPNPIGSWIATPAIPPTSLKAYLAEYHGLVLAPNIDLSGPVAISDDGRTFCGPTWLVRLADARPADFNRDEFVDFIDLADFLDCFDGRSILPPSSADLNRDGMTDFFDIIEFLDDFDR